MGNQERKNWYEEWFSEDYLHVYSHRDGTDAEHQVDLILKTLNPKKGSLLLDLCCGDGRHARILHDAGFKVTGVDLSETFISIAREREGGSAEFEVCDMREIDFHGTFDICVNLFTSFGYFQDDAENQTVLNAVNRSLKKSGFFWIDFLNRDWVINTLVPETERDLGEGKAVVEKRSVTPDGKRIEKNIFIRHQDETREFKESVRMFSKEEMISMLSETGFSIESVFGNYSGGEFRSDSPRLILAARKEDT